MSSPDKYKMSGLHVYVLLSFNSITPVMMKTAPSKRSISTLSLKNKIPTANVNTVPVPDQMAYAVPMGISFCAKYKNKPLNIIAMAENKIHHIFVSDKPAILNPTGQPTSKSAAINKYIQANFTSAIYICMFSAD